MENQLQGLTLQETKQQQQPSDSDSGPPTASAGSNKNYRARYYFEKFHIVPDSKTSAFAQFIDEISVEYLRGLIWCLAYYMKGCVSWTWYFPYHYGPMLCDMTNLVEKSQQISFELGQPFLPFQQLLGCLPPSSLSLLPISYQWLMKSASSPILEYYPIQFEIDMNGKRNPWEAVVLLPFIDSQRLLEAEAMYCAPNTLSPLERQRNSFGKILHSVFDPANLETVPSCNPAIGLLDLIKCQTKVTELEFDLRPSSPFAAQLIPGTVKTCAGFPSLGVLAISGAALEAVKLNVFGSESRYKSIIFTITQRFFSAEDLDLTLLLGRSVFVNYPLIHEAKVVGVSCATKSCKLKTRRVGKEEVQEIEETIHSDSERTQWLKEAESEESRYLKGRGLPGTGGIVIGNVVMRLLVIPLQGMKTDRVTGIRKKVFGETVADIPIQVSQQGNPHLV
jgi:5'-3' exoribonuclease 1